MSAERLQLVTFDLDGTLVDTAGEIAEAANRTLDALGFERRPPAEIEALIGRGAHALMRQLLATLPVRVDEAEALTRFDAHYAQTTGTTSRPYTGAAEALALLREAGLRLACVTNKELVHTRRLLAHHRLDRCFELVVGGDSLPQKKPHASVLRYVAGTLGVPLSAHTVAHVGDSATDVEAARNAGAAAWVLPHGYNAGRPISEARPDRLFPDLMAVAQAALACHIARCEACP